MTGKMPRCPVCGDAMLSAYIMRAGKWVKVAHYCEECSTGRSLDGKVIVV
jgi:hypothetical protein